MIKIEYVKIGHCLECDNEDVRLYRPTVIADLRVVQYTPTCRSCFDDIVKCVSSYKADGLKHSTCVACSETNGKVIEAILCSIFCSR